MRDLAWSSLLERRSLISLENVFEKKREECEREKVANERYYIENMECVCNIINPHTINYNFEVHFDKNRRIPPLFIQKTLGRIMNKIFNRVKQFIENLR